MSKACHRPPAAAACLTAALALAALLGCGGGSTTGSGGTSPGDPEDGFDGSRAFTDLRGQVDLGPRPSGSAAAQQLARGLAAKLGRAGVEGVRIQRPLENVIGTIPGRGNGYVVLGAHYDTKSGIPGFVGANDGASGVAVVLELARSLPNPMPGPSLAIALFDGEEARGDRDFSADGTRGSRQYVSYAAASRQGSPPRAEIEALVLLDMVGDCDLNVLHEEHSDPGLYGLFAEADPETFSGERTAIDDDHVPFLAAGIPAVDLIDFSYGPGPSPGEYWHTSEDTLDKVCPGSLDAIGAAALQALPRIGDP
jgi:glutaminyl-peptide cyclotransferase